MSDILYSVFGTKIVRPVIGTIGLLTVYYQVRTFTRIYFKSMIFQRSIRGEANPAIPKAAMLSPDVLTVGTYDLSFFTSIYCFKMSSLI